MCDVDADKPFICSSPGCGMRFTNEDHLNVHMKKHEMTLAVHQGGPSGSFGAHVPADQTPTPTKFLKHCEEVSLFQELTKNPFEEAFKKASDAEGVPAFQGLQTSELNTPVLPIQSDKTPGLFGVHQGEKMVQSPTASTIATLKQNAGTTLGEGFALDLSGQKAREATLMLASSAVRKHEGGRVISPLSPSRSLPSVIPVVSATEVMLDQGLEMSLTGSIAAISDQGMVSASAVAPHSSSGPQEILMTARTSSSSSSASSSPSSSQDQPPGGMQVYLQLPMGHAVPVHTPTTVGAPLPQVPSIPPPQQQSQQASIATLPTQTQTAELGSHHGVTSSPALSPGTTGVALKQRLKLTLQAQGQPSNPLSPASVGRSPSESGVLSNLSTPVSTSTQMLLNSPSSHFNLADLEPVSKRPKNGSIDTDDPVERRQKFLERNRAAAARCRHKRKQWIVNLEKKAEELQQTNSKLQGEVGLLKGEVAQLKTLLLAHQNCPISMTQHTEGQLALKTISMVESSSSVPLDIGQLISPGPSTPLTGTSTPLTGTPTPLTPVDSLDVGAGDSAAFAVSTSTGK